MQTSLAVHRKRTLLGATAISSLLLTTTAVVAQVPTNNPPPGLPANTGTQSAGSANGNTAAPSENITVRAARQLLREKNSPSGVTELGSAQIAQTGVQGSTATLLRAAPSVYVYQQGIGNNEPVISIRGARGLEVAQTLDGVPMQDLLNGGGGSYLQNLLGGHFNLDQISGVSLYPGVAYPDKSTFGTIGGTIAYSSLRPSNESKVDVFGSVGSFKTFNEGFEVDTGRLDKVFGGLLGTGDDAPKMMLKYSNLQTAGYIDYTPARYNNMEFAFDKPYGDGLSLFQATAIYNTGSGLITPEPVPLPYLAQNGEFSNYSPDQQFVRQNNDYFTLILKNDTYINDYITAGLTAFYLYSDSYTENYGNPTIFAPSGEPGSATVGGASPFNQTVAGFGEQSGYQPGGPYYDPQSYFYGANPQTAGCPASTVAQFAAAGQTNPCGFNSEYSRVHDDTYGFQPRVTITPPNIFGIANTIKIGGLVAKETSDASPGANTGPSYLGIYSEIPHTPANQVNGFDGGTQRTIYQGYAQDKIDLFQNTLHLTPGVTLEGTDSSADGDKILNGTPSASLLATAYCQAGNDCLNGQYKAHKWDREWLPFMNVAYDLDKILPAARGVSLYASYATSALFAPTTDFGPNAAGSGPPGASIVHMYEGGIKYNRQNLSLSFDYFYQHIERDFGFFQYQSGPLQGTEIYSNLGQRESKGIEASAIYQVSHDWQLFGNVSHTLAKYLKTSLASVTVQEDQFGLALRGAPESGVPDWLSTFGVDYDHRSTLTHGDEFNVRFEGQYTGKQATTYDVTGLTNIGSIAGVPPFGTYGYYNATAGQTVYNPNGGIQPFAVFNLDLNYKLPMHGHAGPLHTIDFDLNGLNIFNTRYFQYFYNQISPSSCGTFTTGPFKGQQISNYGCTRAFNDALPGEPAAVTFTVRASF